MRRVLILHGYSAKNRGDGLLVEEALEFIRQAVGDDSEITLCASHPESFSRLSGVRIIDSGLGRTGYNVKYLRTLGRIKDFDLVVGVGGGYLRAGYPLELLKTALIHGPQLLAAAIRGSSVVYLPQSVGPLRYGSRAITNRALLRLDHVMLRDDKSIAELNGRGVLRIPDVAALSINAPIWAQSPDSTPVLSVRELRGKLPPPVIELARLIGDFNGYVQSKTAGNNDESAMSSLEPGHVLSDEEFGGSGRSPRVVVAMRLHGALMALRAGHFVIHLAYERKGFGAFSDLGLGEFVHNTNSFEPSAVRDQIQMLLTDPQSRQRYSAAIESTTSARKQSKDEILTVLRQSTSSSKLKKANV